MELLVSTEMAKIVGAEPKIPERKFEEKRERKGITLVGNIVRESPEHTDKIRRSNELSDLIPCVRGGANHGREGGGFGRKKRKDMEFIHGAGRSMDKRSRLRYVTRRRHSLPFLYGILTSAPREPPQVLRRISCGNLKMFDRTAPS